MADVIIRRKLSISEEADPDDAIDMSFFDDGYLEEASRDEETHHFSDGYLSSVTYKLRENGIQPSLTTSREPIESADQLPATLFDEVEIEADDAALDDALFTADDFLTVNEDEVENAFESYVLDEGFDEDLGDIAVDELSATFDFSDKSNENASSNFTEQKFDEIDFDFDFDLEEQDQPAEPFSVDYEGSKDAEDVASDFAIRLVTEFELDIADYDTLFSLFMESSYEQTATAISNGLNLGLTTEEIGLAAQLKGWWSHRADFMIKIERRTKRGDYSSRIARKILSWNQSFKIIQAFDGCPTLEELEFFMEDLFEYWKSYRTLQREFKSFQGFLLHVCSSIKKTHWMIPNYTNVMFQDEMLCLCRSWYTIEDLETRNQIQAHVGNWG